MDSLFIHSSIKISRSNYCRSCVAFEKGKGGRGLVVPIIGLVEYFAARSGRSFSSVARRPIIRAVFGGDSRKSSS